MESPNYGENADGFADKQYENSRTEYLYRLPLLGKWR